MIYNSNDFAENLEACLLDEEKTQEIRLKQESSLKNVVSIQKARILNALMPVSFDRIEYEDFARRNDPKYLANLVQAVLQSLDMLICRPAQADERMYLKQVVESLEKAHLQTQIANDVFDPIIDLDAGFLTQILQAKPELRSKLGLVINTVKRSLN